MGKHFAYVAEREKLKGKTRAELRERRDELLHEISTRTEQRNAVIDLLGEAAINARYVQR